MHHFQLASAQNSRSLSYPILPYKETISWSSWRLHRERHLRRRWYYPRLRGTYHGRSGRKGLTSIRALLVPTILPTYQTGSRATVIRSWSEITHVRSNVLVPTIYEQRRTITRNIRTSNRNYGLQDGQAVHLPQVEKVSHDSRGHQEVNLRHTKKEKRQSWTPDVRGIS